MKENKLEESLQWFSDLDYYDRARYIIEEYVRTGHDYVTGVQDASSWWNELVNAEKCLYVRNIYLKNKSS